MDTPNTMRPEEKWQCERCCDMHVLYYVDRIENCPRCAASVTTPTGGGTFPVPVETADNFGDDEECECGHTYRRHFDNICSQLDNRRNCECSGFKQMEKTEDHVL